MIDHDFLLTAEKIAHRLELIEQNLFQRHLPLPAWRYHQLEDHPHPDAELPAASSPGWQEIEPHSYWGEWQTNFVLQTSLVIPPDWPASQTLQLYLPIGTAGDFFSHPEMLVTLDGKRLGTADRHHHILYLPADLEKGCQLSLTAFGWTGLASWPPEEGLRTQLYMRPCFLVQRNPYGFDFVNFARAALETAQLEEMDVQIRSALLDALYQAFQDIDLSEPLGQPAYFASLEKAFYSFRELVQQAGPPIQTPIYAIGHAHIDVAYLWRIRQTRSKVRRTFSNALKLMERDEDFRFTQTTPLFYEFCRADDPDLFEGVLRRIRQGRWEAATAMWVETDCNLAGGESLVRQFMLARQFNEQTLKVTDSPVLFLPDSFGFCASLPQLARQAGIDAFVFSKLNWNQSNRFPHSFFEWEGIDGTRLFSHLLTTPREVAYLPVPSTYKAEMKAAEVAGSVARCTIPDMPVMIAYGYGDGGGGPNDILLSAAHAYEKMPGQPELCFSRLDDFMRQARKQLDDAPIYKGELYLELHRGTYTSQAKIKKANRELEAKLLETETLNALASWHKGADYPAAKLTGLWKKYCTNQFHDILPGCSISAVFDDAMADYQAISEQLDQLWDAALSYFAYATTPDQRHGTHCELMTAPLVCCNRTDPTQRPADDEADAPLIFRQEEDHYILQNNFVRVLIDSDGCLTSYHHHQFAELLIEGQKGNQLIAFEDRPLMWDAWDIDPFFEEKQEIIATSARISLVKQTASQIVLKIERSWRQSHIRQFLSLACDSARLDFTTEIDWHESHILLKAAFPVSVQATQARYHIPFGWLARPTSREGPLERARFEVSGHYWADVSDAEKAVALLNDCKYGYDIQQVEGGNQMRLSLIKSSTLPAPQADQGAHHFRYSLLAHPPGDLAEVWQQGYRINRPPRQLGPGYRFPAALLPVTDSDGLFIEAVLWSRTGDGLVIRLYEPQGKKGPQRLTLADQFQPVYRSTILETNRQQLLPKDGYITLDCRPFEVLTLIFPQQTHPKKQGPDA